MTPEEVSRMKAQIEQEQEQEQQMQQDQGVAGAGPGPGEAGGQEPAENVPPTANESVEYALQFMANTTSDEKTKQVMNRILEKQITINRARLANV